MLPKYKRMTLRQRLYLPEIIRGMMLTLKFLFRKKSTMSYPEVKHNFPVGYRGVPRLIASQDGNERCVACKLCEVVCPPVAIYIEAEEFPDQDYRERRPKVFQIDFGRCINCGFCEEACPVEAIEMSQSVEIVGESREALVYQKDKLLAIPEDPRRQHLRTL
ncbi:MAG: NADH-quinone oxidoreductase subunit NuoI [Proteobacteria bacterium]|nr:NADH-quinone oxidoreductase subunit NuoI [Pseudomonadota bacterium]